MNNCVSFKRALSADDEWTRHNIHKMIKSLLWFALGLVALGCAEFLGPQQPVTNEDPMFKHYMCRKHGVCPDTRETPQPLQPQPLNVNNVTEENPEESCQCVPYFKCTSMHGGPYWWKDVCEDYMDTCCAQEDIIEDKNAPPKASTSSKQPTTSRRCGQRSRTGFHLEMEDEAKYGEFPWMMAVLREDKSVRADSIVYVCGGSLIHRYVVLTAAHCVQGKDNLMVRAGEWDTQTEMEPLPAQEIRVSQVIVHEQFEKKGTLNDVALLILERPVNMSLPNVGTICLPDGGENMDNRNCVATGWGKDKFGKEGKYQEILKKVDVPMVSRSRCQEKLQETRLGPRFRLHESFVCAGGSIKGKDTCEGDGGGPLVCPSKNNPNVYVQAGIVAWGINCKTETPGVYVNVPHFVDWIYKALKVQRIHPRS